MSVGAHGDLRLDRRHRQDDGIVHRQRGMDIDKGAEGSEPAARRPSTRYRPNGSRGADAWPCASVSMARLILFDSLASSMRPGRGSPPGSVTITRNSPVLLWLNCPRTNRNTRRPRSHDDHYVQEQTRRSWSGSARVRLTMEISCWLPLSL